MTKNITVIDAQGNIYEATYPKRAKGLVKNGRANFIDETTIMLTCPPDITEDKQMKDTEITAFEQLKENSEPISENSRILLETSDFNRRKIIEINHWEIM